MPRTGALLVLCLVLLLPDPASAQRPTVAIIGTGNMASAMGPNVAEAGYPVVKEAETPPARRCRIS